MDEGRESGWGRDAGRLESLLGLLHVQRLRAMAAARGVETRGANRQELIARLARALEDGQTLRGAVAALPAVARQTMAYGALWDGEAPLSVLRGAAARLGDGTAAAGEGIVDGLIAQGLVLVEGTARQVTVDGRGGAQYGPLAYLPQAARPREDSLLALPPLAQADLAAAAAAPSLAALVARGWAAARGGSLAPPAPRQMHPIEHYYSFLQGWHNIVRDVEELAGRGFGRWRTPDARAFLTVAQPPVGLTQPDRRRLTSELGVGERHLAFLFRLLRAQGLVEFTAGGIVASSARMAAFLARPADERLRMLAQAWLEDQSWSEIFQIRGLGIGRRVDDGGSKQDAMLGSLAAGRRLIARALAGLPAGAWYGFGDLLAALRRLEPALPALPVSAGRPWFVRDSDGRILDLDKAADGDAVAGGFLARMLLGPLSWLGAVELALDPAHGSIPDHEAITAVRLTPQAGALLSVAGLGEGDAEGQGCCACLWLDAGLEVRPTDSTPAAVHALLGDLAIAEVTTAGTLRYRLAPERLEAAADVRAAARELVALLEQHGIPPLAEAAWQAVRRWGEHVGEVALYRTASVVEAADPAALDEVLAALGGRGVICRFSERSLLVETAVMAALRDELVARGHTPRLRGPTR